MKLLVAGCGWLGLGVSRALIARGDSVVGIRRSAAGAQALVEAGIEPLMLDLARRGAADSIPTDVEAVVACQSADGPTADAYRQAYVEVTRELLRAARQVPARLVYTGSSGVFGQADGGDVDETTRPLPASPTGAVLLEAEQLVLDAAASGTDACLVRLSGLYGPGRYGIVERLRDGRLALGPGDRAWMNFCHLEDAVRTVLALIDRAQAGGIHHASDAHPTRRRDVVRWIANQLGVEPATRDAPPRRGSDRRVRAERTRRRLGLELAYPSFREGLHEALR